MDIERIKSRGKGREEARAILDLVTLPSKHHVEGFIEELRDRLCPAVVEEEKKKVEKKLIELMNWRMPFGTHFGERLEDVPRDYLEWLQIEMENTRQIIDEYLKMTENA